MTNPKATGRHREEANVELDLRLPGPLSEDALDERADQIVDALARRAAEIVLGPAVLVEVDNCVVSLRFDVPASSATELHRQLVTVLEIIERDAKIEVDSTKTDFAFIEPDAPAAPTEPSAGRRAAS